MQLYRYIHKRFSKYSNKLRILHLKLLGAQIGENVKAYGRFTVIRPYNLIVGQKTTLNENIHINCRDKVIIGIGVRISTNVQIHSGKLIYDVSPRIHTQEGIYIADNVWLASGVVVSSGVSIGENSIIAANSVVLDDIAANCLYAGSPAKKVKDL